MKVKILALMILATVLSGCVPPGYVQPTVECGPSRAPITGYAKGFVSGARMQHAELTWLEKNKKMQTDVRGRFAFCAEVGERVTLKIKEQSKKC